MPTLLPFAANCARERPRRCSFNVTYMVTRAGQGLVAVLLRGAHIDGR
jgi:hypothetical protein